MRIGIAGAGLSGAVIGRELAEAGHSVVVHEARSHVAGNCHTERDPRTGVLLHRYGPHIFHTDLPRVWAYVNRFADMVPYRHRGFAATGGRVYSLPVNLLTINQLVGRIFTPDDAARFVRQDSVPCPNPTTFEEAALATIGRTLYEAFFKEYTRKQWGRDPALLPASVFHRLPVRFNYDDSYFTHPWQAIPRDGYTAMVSAILDHPNVTVLLDSPYPQGAYDHTIWTGPIDAYFGHTHGRLAYRTLRFHNMNGAGDLQGCPIINYPDERVPWTRITEHKHFAPWERHDRSIITVETPSEAGPGDDPFYPLRLPDDLALLARYEQEAAEAGDVTFVGRLGTYRYIDMDRSIDAALTAADVLIRAIKDGAPLPAFTHNEDR